MIRWAGLPFFFWALDLADGFLAISFHVLSTVDYWACWALDLWWITEVLDLVYRGPKKWASTRINLILVGLILIRVGFFLYSNWVNFWVELLLNEYAISYLSCQ
jgi:hypothetical protein